MQATWACRSLLSAAALLALLAALLAPGYVLAAESVTSFASQIQILPDGSLLVTERIDVQVEGKQVQRGIVRTFPLTYTDKLGVSHPVVFQMLSASRDGQPENYREDNLGKSVDIYLGRADYFLPHGLHSYEIRYRTSRQVSYLEQFDELYWNVTGNDWQLPILSASAELGLPQPVPPDQLHIEGYTGYRGAKGQDYTAQISRPGNARIESTAPLGEGQGLTLVFQWPKGVVAPPSPEEIAAEQERLRQEAEAAASFAEMDRQIRLRQAEQDKRNLVILNYVSAGTFILVLLVFLASWLGYGVDAASGDPRALRGPPEDVSPAGLRYIRRMKYDALCLTTALVSLASKGFLRITQDKENVYKLQRLKDPEPGMPADELAVLLNIFDGADSRQVSSGNVKHFRKATTELQAALKKRYGSGYFNANTGFRTFGACLSCFMSCALTMFGIGTSLLFRTWLPIAALAGLWLLNWAYGRLIPKYTARGRVVLDQFEPLRQALSGGQPIEMLLPSSAPLTPSLFSQYLPYALAMDLQAAWAQQLEQQLKQAAQKAPPPVPGTVLHEQPGYYQGIDWYYNPYQRNFGYGQLVRSLSQGFNQRLLIASTPPPPPSSGGSSSSGSSWSGSSYSGGGGGGFSGGGGGGGGGRGW